MHVLVAVQAYKTAFDLQVPTTFTAQELLLLIK